MAFTKSQVIIIGIGVIIFLFVILLFMGVVPGLRSAETPDISGEITIWGVHDSPPVIDGTLIASYNAIHPNVAVTYLEMNPETYETDLINALASGRGPDAYMIKNTWVPKQADKLSPLTANEYPIANLRATFPSVVEQDFSLSSSTVYGFPMSIDTLALFYNRELFDNAGIANPPTTWEELEAIVPRLRQLDTAQGIKRAAIALGGSAKSISHPTDVLSLMMLQSGLAMNATDGFSAEFAHEGEAVIKRYLNFANPASPLYTWNDQMGSDIEAFAKGETAMMIGYRADMKKIQEKNPFFRFDVVGMPQLKGADRSVNYPAYWGLVVSNTSRNGGLAWDFIGTVLLNSDIASRYATEAEKTPALRTLLDVEIDDVEFGLFARQALTAKSWRQADAGVVDAAFSKMIESVLNGQAPPLKAAETAEASINQAAKRVLQQMQ